MRGMRVRVYEMSGTRAVNIPMDIWNLLGWDDTREVNLELHRAGNSWVIEIKRG